MTAGIVAGAVLLVLALGLIGCLVRDVLVEARRKASMKINRRRRERSDRP